MVVGALVSMESAVLWWRFFTAKIFQVKGFTMKQKLSVDNETYEDEGKDLFICK
jgi:hypothetical protein